MTVQELYDLLGELIEQGRSTLPVRVGPTWWEPDNLTLFAEDTDIFVGLRQIGTIEEEEVDPIEEAVRNATTLRPDQ